ncbi:CAZyme family GT1 [Agaricus bisporus var. burnettii]|uniref:CAZyme family GT1 n=1 Tax=Agaricus bisporus var. burnettii TaxID=192524 RepID=A0A8H7F5L4_AGABI|nr:CAZyme family GT1 [Agaricus bisporus var. burnettii]
MADQDQGNQEPSGSTTAHNHLGAALRQAKEISQNNSLPTSVQLHSDGRINVSLALNRGLPDLPRNHALHVDEFAIDLNWRDCPCMSIVIMVVGSRGDIQPYVALGKRLKQDGHRIRIATHDAFRQFVIDEGLEFFDIGGNPVDLMSYMVRNPGMIPGMVTLTNGDLKKKKAMLKEIIYGCWKSCYAPSRGTKGPFVVDAIISNPPGFAHVHCAEALGIPLQMSFTMPWCPTTAFPHPLVNITNSDANTGLTNYLTYYMADLLTWKGLGSHINKLRKRVLNLEALDVRTGPSILEDLKIPWTYCMSPALVPSPEDWQNHIDVVGFYFLNLATKYEPSSDLVAFLNAGDTPIYIGFGSIVVDNPHALTKLIFEATANAGVRALVSAGWGGLGGIDIPPHIFILESVPHDWLFDNERVSAVVHHGGAGTTAIGLAKGRPTVVVPFFGDQRFWGRMVHRTGAGPKPIPHKKLTIAKLSDAIKYALSATAKEAAQKNSIEKGVQSFYKHLPLLNMRCDLCPSRLAVWWSTKHCLKLSTLAAQTLEKAGLVEMRELELHRTKEYEVNQGFSLTDEVGSVFESVSAAVEKLLSPVKNVFETTSVRREETLNMTSSLPESPTAEPDCNSIADDQKKQELISSPFLFPRKLFSVYL